jgi:hypothetical protein
VNKLSFDDVDETEFEEFCFSLVTELGFVNVDWRKGTGLHSSPSDRGRDIVAYLERTDVDDAKHLETWFIECKHMKRGVPPEKLQSLLSWASAERPHTALAIVSNFLSNPCKDYLKAYEENNRPPFRVKYWERPTLERLTEGRDGFLRSHLFNIPRSQEEIMDAEQELFDRVWYDRKLSHIGRLNDGGGDVSEELLIEMRREMETMVKNYGPEGLGPYDAFEWGMINGKLSALRWVLGDEWDMLDT